MKLPTVFCLVEVSLFCFDLFTEGHRYTALPSLRFSTLDQIYLQFRNEITDSILFNEGQSVFLWSKFCYSSQKGIGYNTLPLPPSPP